MLLLRPTHSNSLRQIHFAHYLLYIHTTFFSNISAVSSCSLTTSSSPRLLQRSSLKGKQKNKEQGEAIQLCGFHKVNPRKLAGYVRLDGDAAEACGDAPAAGIVAAEAA